MMPTLQPTLRESTEGRRVAVVGDIYRFLVTGEETNGSYAMMEAFVPPGGGPPPHVHTREVEGFYILEGEMTFQIGNERVVARSGTFANIPIGVLHSFKNESHQPVKMLIVLSPAGLEKMFIEVGRALDEGAVDVDPPSKEEIGTLLAAAPRYGIEIRLPNHE